MPMARRTVYPDFGIAGTVSEANHEAKSRERGLPTKNVGQKGSVNNS